MYTGQLPRHFSPRKLAYQKATLKGVVPVAACPRLKDLLADDRGEVNVTLELEVDEQRRPLIKGVVSTRVDMVCQRCLEVAQIDIVALVNVAVVRDEQQAGRLPAVLDPLIVEEETVELLPFVEQEILLSMPDFAYHENGACPPRQHVYSAVPEDAAGELKSASQTSRPNPFSVLADLKTSK